MILFLFLGNHFAMTADISNSASVNKIFAKLKEGINAVPTVVINSAGITRDNLLIRATEENFDEVIAVNLKVSLKICVFYHHFVLLA